MARQVLISMAARCRSLFPAAGDARQHQRQRHAAEGVQAGGAQRARGQQEEIGRGLGVGHVVGGEDAACKPGQQAGVAALWGARLASFDGTAWTTPATPLERFVGTPRMTSPAGWLVQSLQQAGDRVLAQWQTTVKKLERHANGWAITSAEHGLHAQRYSAVLLAVPAPQAVPLLQPVAPIGAAVAASARMRGSWAVMVRFRLEIQGRITESSAACMRRLCGS